MPIEVTIDVVPHGVEARRSQVAKLVIRQIEALDAEPEGWRLYEVTSPQREVRGLLHRRGDGALTLVAKALDALGHNRG